MLLDILDDIFLLHFRLNRRSALSMDRASCTFTSAKLIYTPLASEIRPRPMQSVGRVYKTTSKTTVGIWIRRIRLGAH
jgi:hypothetical protein